MARVRPGLFEENSITRRVNRENVLLLGGGRALLMQIAHPKVAAGVDEHSDFRSHPIRRLRRTIRMTMAIVFGDRETALGAARAVNQVHASVRGRDYRALDPDLLLWVHATLADTALVTYETFVEPLTVGEREEFYEEFQLLGELLGIPGDRFPATYADFEDYLEWMMSAEGPVRVDGRALELAAQILRPPVRLLPGRAMLPLNVVTTGLMPSSLREQYRLPWGSGEQRAYRIAVAVLPRVIAITPPLIRVWPRPGRSVVLTAGGRATTS
jgi:uncharacterized protein (DUF2236 family)